MRPQLEKDGFRLDVHLPDAPVTLTADADALSQVLLNLLTNAGKYGGAEDRREITVALHNGDGRVRLSVADRGPGVPRGHERRIFEKFQRAHNTLASGTAGSGLGLTIARRLVEAHGGTLEYTARDGGGAEVTVTLDAA
jgi:signal transduction histidine kinase